jgi:hypothetical protein
MTGDDFIRRFLEKGRELYETGDKEELLYCLDYCISKRQPIPAWLGQAFLAAYDKVRRHNAGSWDDVFGKPVEKGRHLAAARRKIKVLWPLFWRIRGRNATGEPLEDLFREVGKEFGFSSTVAKELYYRADKLFAMKPDDIINRGC